MLFRGCNSHFSLQDISMLLGTPHLSSYIIEFEYFIILFSYLLCIKFKCSVYWITWKKTLMFKKPSFCWSFWYRFPRTLISHLVNTDKVDKDFPHVSALSNKKEVSTGNGSFVFWNGNLELLVADMIFDEICTLRGLVCLCFIAFGFDFMNGKRLHHGTRESRIVNIFSPQKCLFNVKYND